MKHETARQFLARRWRERRSNMGRWLSVELAAGASPPSPCSTAPAGKPLPAGVVRTVQDKVKPC